MVELKEINEENFNACIALDARAKNKNWVDSVSYSLAEAWVNRNVAHPFAIYANDDLIGYVSMVVVDDNPQIINFLIDSRYQNLGYGTIAAQQCIDYLKNEFDAKRISLPVDPLNFIAQKLWSKLGFTKSDVIEDGYVFMRLYIREEGE